MKEIYYRSIQTNLRKDLRKNMTYAETLLWERLRGSRYYGYKFRRQAGIGRYIADFYCFKAKLVIEIDGAIHETKDAQEYDPIRDSFMNNLGLNVLRIRNEEVLNDMPLVLNKILSHLTPSSS